MYKTKRKKTYIENMTVSQQVFFCLLLDLFGSLVYQWEIISYLDVSFGLLDQWKSRFLFICSVLFLILFKLVVWLMKNIYIFHMINETSLFFTIGIIIFLYVYYQHVPSVFLSHSLFSNVDIFSFSSFWLNKKQQELQFINISWQFAFLLPEFFSLHHSLYILNKCVFDYFTCYNIYKKKRQMSTRNRQMKRENRSSRTFFLSFFFVTKVSSLFISENSHIYLLIFLVFV